METTAKEPGRQRIRESGFHFAAENRQPRSIVRDTCLYAITLGLIGGIGILDKGTGFEISFSIFYLIPVSIVAWKGARWAALVASGIAALVWLWADMTSHPYTHPAIPYWNATVRLGIFCIQAVTLNKIRVLLDREQTLARLDPLTGALNSRQFYAILEVAVEPARRRSSPLTLAFADLDNFKQVNDRLGHQAGDAALRAASQAIRDQLRANDVVARLGGDEFAILFCESDETGSGAALRRILSSLLDQSSRNQWGISMSVGAVSFHDFPDSLEEMVRMADHLMYRAKQGGKSRVLLERNPPRQDPGVHEGRPVPDSQTGR